MRSKVKVIFDLYLPFLINEDWKNVDKLLRETNDLEIKELTWFRKS